MPQKYDNMVYLLSFILVFSCVRVAQSLVFCVVFCGSLFVLFSFSSWSLYCPSFFDLRLLITPFVSSNVYYTFLCIPILYFDIHVVQF